MPIENNIKPNKDGSPHLITEIYAFIVMQQDGEGIPAVGTVTPNGKHPYAMPLLGSDAARIDSLREVAQAFANEEGIELTLCRFSMREEVEKIKPVISPIAQYDRMNECPYCDYKTNRASQAVGDGGPEEGALSFCMRCGELSVFGPAPELKLRAFSAIAKEELNPEFKATMEMARAKWEKEIKPQMDQQYGPLP